VTLPIVADWFRIRDVAPGLTQIDEPYAHEFVRGNIWWRHGRDHDLLVDTGLGVASLREALRMMSATQGRAWREPIVVLTHGHPDHAGGAAEFEEVRAHPSDTLAAVTSLHGTTFAQQLGVKPDPSFPAGLLVSASPRAAWDPGHHEVGEITAAPAVAGQIIDLGDRQYEVLHLPGHTHGSIALLDRTNRELFSGDVVYDDELLDDLHESDARAYRRSMDLLGELDIDLVRPGHGSSFDRYVLERIIRSYTSADRTSSHAGGAPPLT
jgi:glyoxylase-like metal-dependent hydrolase (beta-lactamase superfamily II)